MDVIDFRLEEVSFQILPGVRQFGFGHPYSAEMVQAVIAGAISSHDTLLAQPCVARAVHP